jgi:hypothetical protein
MFVGKAKSLPIKGNFFQVLLLVRLKTFSQKLGYAGKASQ